MDELVAWLRAVLDEDERAARKAVTGEGGGEWNYHESNMAEPGYELQALFLGPSRMRIVGPDDDDALTPAEARHVALHNPDAVLADIGAKRAILEQADRAVTAMRTATNPGNAGAYAAWQTAMRLLASAYRDRPGYRDEWRP